MSKLYLVGMGPGDAPNMTLACHKYLSEANIIVGYSGYLKLLRPLYPQKSFFESGMTQECERCQIAIDMAVEGLTVCIVSSGDSGVYGMATLVFELVEKQGHSLAIEVIPGVTAATSGAALLGAPLSNDFAVISLSDLLTPWDVIECRLRAAAMGDFTICLYNPGSSKRSEHLRRACEILNEFIPKARLCGIARNIGRDDQATTLLSLEELSKHIATMNETIYIGNSLTRLINTRMVTPRGYFNA